jgi:RNA polymerase sigma factor (sigma-70 family)
MLPCREMKPDQNDLLAAAARSEADAWRILIARHGKRISAVTRAFGLREADAADVSQTVWLRLLEHIGDIRDPGGLGSWLATTTRRECLRLWRQKALISPPANPGVLEELIDDADGDALRRVETQGHDAQLRAVVATLPARHQAMLGLLMSEPARGYGGVAEDLGIPVGSIGPTRQRCLRTLQAKCLAAGIGLG